MTVRPGDPRYGDLAGRGSGRFSGRPDYVQLVGSTEQVVDAVQAAVRGGLRVAVRSGGHCLENFVADPAVRVVIDTSLLADVYYDPARRAFAIEPGARLGEAYRTLFLGWGVVIPAGVSYTLRTEAKSWLGHALDPAPGLSGPDLERAVFKLKDALLRRRFSDRQIEVAYDHLTRTDHDVGLSWGMATYGGQVNAVAPDATASAHRDSVLTTSVTAGWAGPADEDAALTWVRRFYRDLFADTGGVPVPAGASGGASINHADVDLADPGWNTSGVPWHAIYYEGNYARLQQVKSRWDPLDVFHHALSVRPADDPPRGPRPLTAGGR